LHWENYATAWVSARMSKYFLNSVSVSVVGVGLTALIASMAAYILARFRFRGSGVLLGIFISGLAIPLELILVPVYLIFHALKLSNSLVALTALYAAVSLPFSIFVLTGFFRTLPRELEEAAVLDGASEYGVFWRVMMPLVRPGLITVSVFNFLFCWNEYMLALFLLSKAENMTVPVGLYNLKSVQGYRGDWVSMFAGLMIVLLPTAVIFLIAQRRIVGGLTLGALKG
jgi:ABC-type glycerol-3-phosphate transport system permease component